jgi:hypothetical protein
VSTQAALQRLGKLALKRAYQRPVPVDATPSTRAADIDAYGARYIVHLALNCKHNPCPQFVRIIMK